MKQFKGLNSKFIRITVFTVGLALLASGCSGVKKAPDASEGSENQTQGQVVTPVENSAAKEFDDIVAKFRKEIPYVDVQTTEATKEEQQSALDAMEMLYSTKGTSKETYALYTSKIESLRGKMADDFTRYAIAILRKNSFEDYKPFEKYFSDMKHLETFGNEAQVYEFNYYRMKQHMDDIKDPDIKAFVKEASEQGYILESTEGMVYPVVDYAVFAKYKSVYSADFGSLLDVMAFGSLEVQMNDAAIAVPLEHFSAIALEIEKDLKVCQDAEVKKYLGAEYINYIRTLFFGSDNSPMYDYDSLKVREEVVSLYKKIAKIDDSMTATYVKDHMALLEASGGKYDNATMEKINALISQIQKDNGLTDDDLNAYYDWMSGNLK